jgi:hypothetical protein
MTCNSDLLLNPGQDFILAGSVMDDAGDVDLTGYSASVFDVTGLLAGAVTAAVVDAKLRLSVIWQAGWPVVASPLGAFRVQLVNGAAEVGSFAVKVFVVSEVCEVTLARGSDLTVGFVWPDDGDGADLSGDVIDLINVATGLQAYVSVQVTDAGVRAVQWHIEGDTAMPLGDLGTFQMRRSTGGANRRTLGPIRVVCA